MVGIAVLQAITVELIPYLSKKGTPIAKEGAFQLFEKSLGKKKSAAFFAIT